MTTARRRIAASSASFSTTRSALACAAFTALCCLASGAQAQSSQSLQLGLGAGSSDYGTALKAQIGSGLKLGLAGPWRWEAQLASFGSETYTQFGNSYKRSAWAVGASVLPILPLSSQWSAYGKLGVHHLRSEASGPGLDSSKGELKLGYGAGLFWQVNPRVGLKLEAENIGGSGGDLVTLAAQIPLD